MNRTDRNKLVIENLPLVGYLVSDLCAKATHLSRDDLASVGAIALITCAESYDPTLGVPFGAYARRRITGSFADELRANDWAPRTVRRKIRETLSVQETLTGALGRTPTADEIATALGVSREEAAATLADAGRTVSSLDETLAEFLVADSDQSPEAELLVAEKMAFLREAVAALPEKMRYIVEEVYFQDRTVKELAAELGLTHSAISQQRAEAIRLLRDGMTTHYNDDDAASQPSPAPAAAPRRLNGYLEALGQRTSGGIARLSQTGQTLEPAV